MCADGANWNDLVAPPDGANSVEWPIEMTRAAEAAARAFWPLGNTRLEKRLGLIAGADPDPVGRPGRRAAAQLRAASSPKGSTARAGSKPSPTPAIWPTSTSPTPSPSAVLAHFA